MTKQLIAAAKQRVRATTEAEDVITGELNRFHELGLEEGSTYTQDDGTLVFLLNPIGASETEGALSLKTMDLLVKACNLAGSKLGKTLNAAVVYSDDEGGFELYVAK